MGLLDQILRQCGQANSVMRSCACPRASPVFSCMAVYSYDECLGRAARRRTGCATGWFTPAFGGHLATDGSQPHVRTAAEGILMRELNGITTLIWDLDGALVDTMPDIVSAFRAAARSVGYGDLSDEQTANKVGRGAHEAFRAIFGEEDARFVEPAMEHFRLHYPEHCADESRLYPGVAEVLERLHGPVRFALVTAKIRSATQGILDALDVLSYFDLLVTADDMQRMKPDPHGIQIVLDEFGVNNPLNAVIVGDMATDIQAGRAAGIRPVAVTYGYGPRAELVSASADALIDSPTELLGLIGFGSAFTPPL